MAYQYYNNCVASYITIPSEKDAKVNAPELILTSIRLSYQSCEKKGALIKWLQTRVMVRKIAGSNPGSAKR